MTAPYGAVVGWPAAHSLSPLMMKTWLEASGQAGFYGVLETPPAHLSSLLSSLKTLGLTGVNVTLPHKQAALAAADTASPVAERVGAANLVTLTAAGLHAHNTDVDGVAAALSDDDGIGPAVLIGAGGAARAALYYLGAQDREIRLVNRTRSRAEELAGDLGVACTFHDTPDEAMAGAGLIINATSLGMAGQGSLTPDFSRTATGALAFDMVYTPLRSSFLNAAHCAARRTCDGLTMLIGQARPSFEAFYGALPPPGDDEVRAALEARLGVQS